MSVVLLRLTTISEPKKFFTVLKFRQITETNPLTNQTIASYSFDPTPRPVVTQPVKFFNEANRSGSGVEDAILGLIAEKDR